MNQYSLNFFLPKLDQITSFDGVNVDVREKNGTHGLGRQQEIITAKENTSNTIEEKDKDLEVIEMEENSQVDEIECNDINSKKNESEGEKK